MSIGTSGRIVIEVDPQLKRELHSAVLRHGLTLKSWFLSCATSYLEAEGQMTLPLQSNPEPNAQEQRPISRES